jgi:hypothetical protein
MLSTAYFDSLVAFYVGRSIISWYSSFVEDVKVRQGVFILTEVIDEIETEEGREHILASSPSFIFGGTLFEVKTLSGTEYLIVNWQEKEIYFGDILYVYIDYVKYKYSFIEIKENRDLNNILFEVIPQELVKKLES